VQFVLAGFNNEMATLIEAFGADDVICKDLLLCGFSSAKPLLKLIVDANRESNLKAPLLLFETIKSPSGLVGL
jgi:hypothetical protein